MRAVPDVVPVPAGQGKKCRCVARGNAYIRFEGYGRNLEREQSSSDE